MSDAPEKDAVLERTRAVHRRFPTGVTVVTVCVDGEPYGLAVNAFSSLSLDPPTVLTCVAKTSATYTRLFATDRMAINLLAADQADVARVFAKSGGDKFGSIDWQPGPDGVPILDGVAGWFDTRISHRIPVHTHSVFIADVLDAHASDRKPLLYYEGGLIDSAPLGVA